MVKHSGIILSGILIVLQKMQNYPNETSCSQCPFSSQLSNIVSVSHADFSLLNIPQIIYFSPFSQPLFWSKPLNYFYTSKYTPTPSIHTTGSVSSPIDLFFLLFMCCLTLWGKLRLANCDKAMCQLASCWFC